MLNVANLSKPSDKQESQTISSLYNLLLNNDFIRWNGTEIKIRPPQGLTTINKINFRSFTGDLLPYTSLDLPDLNITLKIFVSDNFDTSMYTIILDGCDNTEGIEPYHEVKNEQNASDTTRNIITSFNKAWTYESSADSQIEYNINELINYLNEVLLSWFGPISTKYYLGINNGNNWSDYDLTLQHNSENIDGQIVLNSSGTEFYIPTINSNNEYVLGDKITINIKQHKYLHASCYNGMLFVCDGSAWLLDGYYYDLVNKKSLHVVSNDVGTGVDKRNTALFDYGDVPHAYVGDLLVIAPYKGWKEEYHTFIIVNKATGTSMKATFDATTYYRDFVICGINKVSDDYIKVYTLAAVNLTSTALCLVPFNIYFNNDLTSIDSCTMATDEIINNIITIDEYKRQNMQELNDGLIFEDFREISYGANSYLYFDGKVIIHKEGDFSAEYPRVRYLHTYKMTQEGETFAVSNQQECEYGNYNVPMSKIPLTSLYLNQNVDYALRKGHYPHSNNYLDNSYPIIYLPSETGINSYYQNGKICNCKEAHYFNKFECYYMNNGIKQYPINSIDNHISYNDTLFEYKDGTISFPSIVWNENSFITFVPIITTSPKYFNICYNIPQTTTLSDYSITQNDATTEFHGLNQHVYSTLETLLLLKYEYNDLMLRVNNFPNTDNFVFSINETCNVDFKKMNCNSNNQELNINLCDSSGNAIDYDTIKRLYGKVILAIDWEQT